MLFHVVIFLFFLDLILQPHVIANAMTLFLDYNDDYYYFLLHGNQNSYTDGHLLIPSALYVLSLTVTTIMGT